jgi:hypothetical protein
MRHVSLVSSVQRASNFKCYSNAAASSDAKLQNDINISDSCVQRLKQICSDDGSHLRITVEGGGCSGFQYKFDIDNTVQPDDR